MALTKVPSNLDATVAITQSASDNSTNIATTAYVTTAIANLVDGAPSTLNTLDEIAAALNDDAALNTTLTNSIATKLPLAGGTMTGDLILGDNVKLEIGSASGGDLQIYHAGSASYISEQGTGDLIIQGSNTLRLQGSSNQELANFSTSGAVTLFHNGSARLETASGGVTIHEDTDKVVRFIGNIGEIGDVTGFQATNTAATALTDFGMRATTLRFATGSDERMRIDSNGNVGIGTNNPLRTLSVKKDTGITAGFNDITEFLDTTIGAGGSVSLNVGRANSTRNLGKMAFKFAGAGSTSNALNFGFYDADNLMTLTAGGQVGIATTNPASLLHLEGNTNTYNTAPIIYFGSTSTANARVRDWAIGPADSDYGNFHIFQGASTGAAAVGTAQIAFTIDSNKNVGIGTTTPGTAKLNVTAGSSASTTVKFGSHFDTAVQIQATATASGMLQFLNASGTSKISLGYRDDGTGGDGQFRIRHAGTLDTAGPMINMATNGAVSVVTDTSASPVGNSHAQLTVKTSVNANPAYAVLSFDSGVGRLGVIEGQQRAGGSAGYGHISTILNNGQSGSGAMVRAITANYTGKVGVGKGHNITPDMNLEVYAYNETSQWTSSGSYHGGTQAFGILSNSPPGPVAGDYGYFKDFWYYMQSNTSHTMIWDNSDSYFNAEVLIVAACTNGGSNNNVYARGFWTNNHTAHRFAVIEGMTQTSSNVGSVIVNGAAGGIGALANGNTFVFTASQGTQASNSGKLTLVHSYPGGSFYGAKIRVRVFFGQFNGHSNSS